MPYSEGVIGVSRGSGYPLLVIVILASVNESVVTLEVVRRRRTLKMYSYDAR